MNWCKIWEILMKVWNSLEWQWSKKRHNFAFCAGLIKSVDIDTQFKKNMLISNFEQSKVFQNSNNNSV
jgi:hypothetical protein